MKNIKKFLSLFLCFLIAFSLVGCSSRSIGGYYKDDDNNNYKSSDIDENGDPIYSSKSSSNFFDNWFGNNETESSEVSQNSQSLQTQNTTSQYIPEDTTGKLVVHFIDCGNADCNFIEFPNGQCMLIDAGNNPDGEDICTYISHLGYSRIDYLVGTHPHEDHIGGLDDVINTFDIGDIYMPIIPDKYVPSTKTYEDVLMAIVNKNLSATSPSQDDVINIDTDTTVTFLSSPEKIQSDDMNKYSIVLKIQYKDKSFMFTGDADEEVEEDIVHNSKTSLRCNVLKVGHHGSYTATSSDFLYAVFPGYAFIPCGAGNQYGHPHQETLDKLSSCGITTYRADTDGTVVMICDGYNIDISTKMTGDVPLGDSSWNGSMIKD